MKSFLHLHQVSLVSKTTRKRIIDHVSLDIFQEDFVIILGSNGSGKSSLIKLINGLFKPTSGQIICDTQNITHLSLEQRSNLFITLTQDLNMTTFDELTVLENAMMALLRHRSASFSISHKKEREFFHTYLKEYHKALPDHLDTPVHHLSGGERQLLALALCLLSPPKVLFLDEHTSALDPKASEFVMKKTFEIVQKHKITTLMTSHKIEEALTYGNRLIVMQEGKITREKNEKEKQKLKKQDILALYDL
jgi:putative ABC transport system ATP-binding protein